MRSRLESQSPARGPSGHIGRTAAASPRPWPGGCDREDDVLCLDEQRRAVEVERWSSSRWSGCDRRSKKAGSVAGREQPGELLWQRYGAACV
jgi:hypothetical protein